MNETERNLKAALRNMKWAIGLSLVVLLLQLVLVAIKFGIIPQ